MDTRTLAASLFTGIATLRISILCLSALLACGCGKPYRVYTPEPLSMQQRTELGKIAVVVAAAVPAIEIEAPKARVAPGVIGGVVGAGGGFGLAVAIAAPTGMGAAPVFAAVAPFTIIGGAVGGAAGGASLGYVSGPDREAAKGIKALIPADGFNPYVHGAALEWARSQNQYLLAEPDSAPANNSKEAERTWFADHGFQSSLQLRVTHAGLRIVNARQAIVFVALHTHVKDGQTNRAKYESFLEYTSPPCEFDEWRADDAQAVLSEIQKGTEELVRRAMYELFERTEDKTIARDSSK